VGATARIRVDGIISVGICLVFVEEQASTSCTDLRDPARRRRSGRGHAVQGRGTEGPRRPARTASSRHTRGPPRGWGPAPRRLVGTGSQPARRSHPTLPRPPLLRRLGSTATAGLFLEAPLRFSGAARATGEWRQVVAVTFIRFAFAARPVPLSSPAAALHGLTEIAVRAAEHL